MVIDDPLLPRTRTTIFDPGINLHISPAAGIVSVARLQVYRWETILFIVSVSSCDVWKLPVMETAVSLPVSAAASR